MNTQALGRGHTTSAEAFWYVLGCIAFGAFYFAKVPIKRALWDYGLEEPTEAEKFWYVLMNIAFGAGYLAKVVAKKALSEVRFDGTAAQTALPSAGRRPEVATGRPAGLNTDVRPRAEGAMHRAPRGATPRRSSGQRL